MIHQSEAVDQIIAENMALQQRVQELQQECSALEHMLNVAPVFLYVYDLVEQRSIFGNTGLGDILGYTDATELMQMGEAVLSRLMHPDDLARFAEHIARFATLPDHATLEFTYRMQHIDGSWRQIVSRDRVFRRAMDGTPQQIIGTVQDVTEQKQTQDAMHLARLALDQAGDAIFWTDSTGHFIYANHAACASLGYTYTELLALRINDIDHTVSPERWQAICATIQQHGTATFEAQHWRKDGSIFPVEVTTSSMAFDGEMYTYGFVRDITERKQSEKQLRLAQFTLNRAVDSIQWLAADGSLVYVNDTACTTLGYTREELLSMRIFDIDPFFSEAQMGPVWNDVKQQGVQIFEAVHRGKDGHDIPVEVVSNYLEFEGQEYACTFARNIATRKQEELERAVLLQQVIDAQRAAIRELSTPLIPLSDTAMIMPLIGTIDSARALQIMETLLEGVARHQAAITILDITGVQVVDTQVASALLQAAQAVRLLGAQVILTGIRPDVAQTLVHLGADLSGIVTRGTLQAGVAYALRQKTAL